MKREFLLLFFLCLSFVHSFAQKNATEIDETVLIKNNVSMKQTEVTVQQWMDFIVNNNYDNFLFPKPECLSNASLVLFEDLKKKKYFEYLKVLHYGGKSKELFGLKTVVVDTPKIEALQAIDTNYFSIYNPITGITFEQAEKYCEWKENITNRGRSKLIKISLPTMEVYKQAITNIDSFCKQTCDSCEL